MSRVLSAEMQAVASAELVRPIYLMKAEFDSGDLNLWSGMGSITFGSDEYLGAGDFISISAINESSELTASGISVNLVGVKQSLLSIARDEPYQGRAITFHLGALDENGDLIASPVVIFSGFMDVMKIADSGETSVITMTCENKLIAFERSSVRRYTSEDQKIDYPDDKGFEFVAKIQQKEIVWGRPTPVSQNNTNITQSPGYMR